MSLGEDFGIKMGKAKIGFGDGKKMFKLAQGSNIVRLLPPLGELASAGTWAVKEAVHWGYKDSRDRWKLFRCIQRKDFKTKMVLERCPQCDANNLMKERYEAKLQQLVTGGVPEEAAKARLAALADEILRFNLDAKYYINVLNEKLEIGRLPISGKHQQVLEKTIRDLQADGLDPFDINQGVWIDLFMQGKGSQCVHQANVVQDMVVLPTGNKAKVPRMAPLAREVLMRLKDEAWDLRDMFRTLTAEQIQRLVDSKGAPGVVDAAFASGVAVPNVVATAVEEDDDTAIYSNAPVVATVKPVPVAAPAPVVASVVAAAQPVQQVAVVQPLPVTTKAINDMSDDEFMAQFGGVSK